jgi:hypothetical protein
MRKSNSFLPALFIFLIYVSLFGCNHEEIKARKIYKSSPAVPGHKKNPDIIKVKNIIYPDSVSRPAAIDSVRHPDTLNTIKDSTVFSKEQVLDSTSVRFEPMRKPTYRQFYKYMNLHRRSPISCAHSYEFFQHT